ncbi:hypothetical protein M885DRAFT_541379 [Pelagophyceae sp. CCMP2097]|nr:hypothetical protein M885DRAFT_541379 [Pelagophyceae sp. CCMP2097]
MFDFAARGAPGVGAAYALKKVDAARAALARSDIYSKGTLSKSSFDDPAMRKRDQALFEAGGGTGKAPFLTRRGLVTWVRAEYAVFRMFARQMMLEGREYSKGNPFCQGLNDGATLKNKDKNLAVGLEFIDPKLLQNHTICLGMVRVLDGTNIGVARKVEEVSQAVLGHSYGDVFHSTIADFAAIGVCSELDHEEEGCDMHDDDKLGRAAVGDLVRSRKKVVVNPFDDCQAILTKVKDAAVYFTYDGRRKKLETYIQLIPGGCANVRLKTDLNKTRVAARYALIYSVLRMSKVLKLFAVANPSVTWKLTDLEWEMVAEIEAVLRISGEVATILQTEQHYMGALGRCILVDMLQKYRAEKLWVIDLENVPSSNVLPRKPKSTFDGLTVIGAETLRRGLLEAERRHCGNKTEVVSGSSNVWRDKLEALYVRYAVNADEFEAAKTARARAAATAMEAGAPMVDSSAPVLQPAALRKRPVSRDASWSDESDDDDDAMADAGPPAVRKVDRTPAFKAEFKQAFKNYRGRLAKLNWHKLYPEAGLPDAGAGGPDDPAECGVLKDFLKVDICRAFKLLIAEDPDRKKYGHLPYMATHSRGGVGSLLASSFCERINFAANLVLTKGNSVLANEEIDMCTTLRMNRTFMQFMRIHYNHISLQQYKMTVVTEEDNEPDEPDEP